MNFIDAAKKILADNGNTPMTPREIWDDIAKQNLVQTNGKTPHQTLDTNLRIFMRGSNINPAAYKVKNPKGIEIFEAVGNRPQKFRLITGSQQTQSIPTAVIDHFSRLEDELPKAIVDVRIPLYQITSEDLGWEVVSVFNDNGNTTYEKSKCDNYTYVMKDASRDKKIGTTAGDPNKRLAQLRTANPSIEIYHVFPSTLHQEKELHNKFEESRRDGSEWFGSTKSLEKFLGTEIEKHEKVMEAYIQNTEATVAKNKMLAILEPEKPDTISISFDQLSHEPKIAFNFSNK
jgi:hypothetical protein